MIQIEGEPYLTSVEAAELLGIKVPTLYVYVSRGVLKSYRQGIRRERLYRQRDLRRMLVLQPSRGGHPLPHASDWVGDS